MSLFNNYLSCSTYLLHACYNTVSVLLHRIISVVASYLNCREGSPVLLSSICLQLSMCAHHLTFVAEPKLRLWLLQDVDVWPIMVNSLRTGVTRPISKQIERTTKLL